MLYAPVDVVVFVFPVTFCHVPLTFFWSCMVAPAIGPDVALSVPLIVKGVLAATVVTLAAAVSVVGIRPTVTVTTGLVAAPMNASPA